MKPTRHNSDRPATPGTGVHSAAAPRSAAPRSAVRRTLWVLGPLVLAVPVSLVLAHVGAGADWTGAVWLATVLWAIAASFVQALWQGLRHGDWSAFTCCDVAHNDEDLDWATKTGKYAYLRIRADHEALMRESDLFIEDHDHNNSRP